MVNGSGRARRVQPNTRRVEVRPPLDIPGIDEFTRITPQQVPAPDGAEILAQIRNAVLAHDPTAVQQLAQRAKDLNVYPHSIERAKLAAVDDEAEGRLGNDPWLPKQ